MGFTKLVVFLAAVAGIWAQELVVATVDLEDGVEQVITSPGYPDLPNGSTELEWTVNASEGSVISVTCQSSIKQRGDAECLGEVVSFTFGEGYKEICRTWPMYKFQTSTNTMTVAYSSGTFPTGTFICKVLAASP